MLQEFKKFAMRGNVIDLAVGVIIGAAFGAIVTSLVNDLVNLVFVVILLVDKDRRLSEGGGLIEDDVTTDDVSFLVGIPKSIRFGLLVVTNQFQFDSSGGEFGLSLDNMCIRVAPYHTQMVKVWFLAAPQFVGSLPLIGP